MTNASDRLMFKRLDEGTVAASLELLCGVDDAEVLNVETAPSHRRRGLATSLLQEAMDWARQNRRSALWLEVRASNKAAIDLYLKMGFAQISTRACYYADGEDALVMKYTL
jgi:[ribosomal protein S18]-alanine N-acetyltransferase